MNVGNASSFQAVTCLDDEFSFDDGESADPYLNKEKKKEGVVFYFRSVGLKDVEGKSYQRSKKPDDDILINPDNSVESNFFYRTIESVKSFFSEIFNSIKSWFGFSLAEGERLPAAVSAAAKNIEMPQIQVGAVASVAPTPELSNSQPNASVLPSFELQTEKIIGQELIRSYALTAEKSKKFADEIVLLQDSLLTNRFRKDMGIPLESGRTTFTKDFGRGFNYNINYKKKFFNAAVQAAKSSPESWKKLITSLRKEMLFLCNGNKQATEVLTRYLNQQIGAPLMEFMLGLPLGDKQGKGYFVANSDLDFYLEKKEKSDPIKIVVKTYWPNRKSPDSSKIVSLQEEFEEGADGVERFAHLASKINCSFELEFDPPKFLFNKSFNETKVSDYFQYMTLTKGLVVEVHRSFAQPSE